MTTGVEFRKINNGRDLTTEAVGFTGHDIEALKKMHAENGNCVANGINVAGVCQECNRNVKCWKGYGCCDLAAEDFKCPIRGCDGYIKPSQIHFVRCTYYSEWQTRIKMKCDPPGAGKYHTSFSKTVSGNNEHKF